MKRGLPSSGFTLAELLVAATVGSCIIAGLMTGAVALQRGFTAARYQVECQEDQMRVIDYISRDLRRAISVTISDQNRNLMLTVPDQIDPATATVRVPTIVKGVVQYGTTPVTVSYFVSGTAFIRRENNVDTILSTNRFGLEDFFAYNDTPSSNPALVRFQISFVPQFSQNAGEDQRTANRYSAVVRLRNKAVVITK